MIATASFLYSEENEKSPTELSVEQARELYGVLENLKGQKSLFPEEVSAENLVTLLNEKYTSKDVKVSKEDNEIILANCILIKVLEKSGLITFDLFFENERGFSDAQLLKILNEFNSCTYLAFAYYSGSKIKLQYHMTYVGGIHADNFNETISWVFDVASEFYKFMRDYKI